MLNVTAPLPKFAGYGPGIVYDVVAPHHILNDVLPSFGFIDCDQRKLPAAQTGAGAQNGGALGLSGLHWPYTKFKFVNRLNDNINIVISLKRVLKFFILKFLGSSN
jgi:hypothetical protein